MPYASANPDCHLSILMLNPDRGDRYLETIYDLNWLQANQIELYSQPQLAEIIHTIEPIQINSHISDRSS